VRRPARTARLSVTALLTVTAAFTASLGSPASAQVGLPALPGHAKVMKTLDQVKDSVLPTENRLPVVGGAPAGLPLQYGGGAVQVTNTTYAIFWEPPGHASSANYKPLVTRWFQDVGGSALFGTTTQYYQGSGTTQQNIKNISTFGGSYVDTDPFPAGGITDAVLQAEVKKVLALKGWPAGNSNQYFVYSGPGGETVASYCAYHSYVVINGLKTPYADEPYGGQSGCTTPTSPNGDAAADSIINTTSHEQWETITDPNTGDGWVAADGDEGSDQCNFSFGTTDAGGADVRINGHPYIVQKEWSNAKSPFGCVMS
jgi:hypothetical protein